MNLCTRLLTCGLMLALAAPATSGAAETAPANAPQPATVRLDNAHGHATLGRDDAPVTIVEFTDLQCPYCARFARDTFPQIRQQLIDTGKVRFVTRDLALAMHAQARPAAIVARCAAEQGRYWEFREALFAQQGALGDALYGNIAEDLGLDAARLADCRAHGGKSFDAAIRADQRAANEAGITGTPTFIVGATTKGEFTGERIVGAKPFRVFDAAVTSALAAIQ